MTREEIQSNALQAWIDNDCNGALILGTGVGKTKIAIDAIKFYRVDTYGAQVDEDISTILWLTNSERLRDVDTIEDFKKWNASKLLPLMQFECIQTAYKWKDQQFGLVVVDEGDFMLTPEYFKFFTNNTFSNILFLTATVDKNKQEMLDSLTKTVYTYTTSQAQEDGILNKSNITLVKFMLDDKDKYIETKGKGNKRFYQTENQVYEYLERRCQLELVNLNHSKDMYEANSLISTTDTVTLGWLSNYEKAQRMHKFWTTKRANFLWSLKSSRQLAIKLLKKHLLGDGNESNKALVFSKRTEQVELICKNTYHAKNKDGNTSLEDLSAGSIKACGVVQAVNRGVNLVGLTHIIKESYDGSSTSFQQQHGRGTRLAVDEIMSMMVLVPYYVNKKNEVKPTQAYKWAKDMTSDFNNIKEIEV